MSRAPNILLVMADQLVPFLTGAYGHPVVRTPSLDRLAAAGIRFDAAYTPYPLCPPAPPLPPRPAGARRAPPRSLRLRPGLLGQRLDPRRRRADGRASPHERGLRG